MSPFARALVFPFWTFAFAASLAAQPAADSAQRSLAYLRRVMDEYHTRFPVYDDVSSAGNHFHAYAKIPDQFAPVDMNGSWTVAPHSGATAIRCEYKPTAAFGGFYLLNGTLTGTQTSPQPNFGSIPDAGFDLTGATALTFWARGELGNEKVDFFVGGVGRNAATGVPESPYPDSTPRTPPLGHLFTLSQNWQKFTIDLTGRPMHYILGGLGWIADSAHDPGGVVFYLDDIQFEFSAEARARRLDQPRFLRSYTTLPLQPDPFDAVKDGDLDFVFRNLAVTYDNALALLAFVADGSTDSVRRASLIGDAFIYAMQHDRVFVDDRTCEQAIDPRAVNGARLRSAYAAGDLALPPGWLPFGKAATVAIPGYYAESRTTFYEIEQQGLDAGNNAWAMVALEALHERTGNPKYRDAACRLGNFLRSLRNDTGTYRGFTGGLDDPDGARTLRPWASTEHNLDIYAAFASFFRTTADPRWLDGAQHARDFVAAMWDPSIGCYRAGTIDPTTRNEKKEQLSLDVQAWSVLALPKSRTALAALRCAEANHLTSSDGFRGFDFNNDKDGVWFEGTAQMAVAYALVGRSAEAELYRAELRRAQQTPGLGDGEGLPASSHDGVSTGFDTAGGDPFKYFRRLHVGATAWNVFAQLGFDPYSARFAPSRRGPSARGKGEERSCTQWEASTDTIRSVANPM